MDITSLFSVGSANIANAVNTKAAEDTKTIENSGGFDSLLTKAIDNINTTNAYLSDAENEEIKWAMGETDNTHDLTIALEKASTSLQYTVAIRDRLLDAYKELMQMSV